VYSVILDLSDYYDGEHVWDEAASVKRIKLQRVKGYLFDGDGNLDQEFESVLICPPESSGVAASAMPTARSRWTHQTPNRAMHLTRGHDSVLGLQRSPMPPGR